MADLSPRQATLLESLTDVVRYLEGRLETSDREPLYPLHADTSFKLDQLMEADSHLCQLARVAVDVPAKMPHNKLKPGDLVISGSCSEGCMLARWFQGWPKSAIVHPGLGISEAVAMVCRVDEEMEGERAVSVGDVVAQFLSGVGKGEDERHPDRMPKLKTQACLLANLICGPNPGCDGLSNMQAGPSMPSTSDISGRVDTEARARSRSYEYDWGQAKACKDPWEIEVDVLCDMGTIPEQYRALVLGVEGRPTNVMLPFCEELEACLKPGLRQKIQDERKRGRSVDLDTEGFLDPFKIKKFIGIIGIFSDIDNLMPVVLAWIFRVPAKNVQVSVQSETTKTSHQFTINAQLSEHQSLNLASDFVGCIRVEFWPDVAREWITRARAWPEESIIRGIVAAGCGLVPRSEQDRAREFKWAFSNAENKLANIMSKHQRKCYFLLKMMFYRYVKSCHSELCSYMMKTLMLWVCEENPPSHSLWTPEKLISTVNFLFGKAEHFFRRGNLPMYFIREANLLEGKFSPNECQTIADKISEVRTNLAFLIPYDIPHVVTSAMTQARAVSRLVDIVEAMTDNTLNLFVKMLMQEVVGETQPMPYSFDQCWQEEVDALIAAAQGAQEKKTEDDN